jgi:hypothetical protein
MTDKKEPITLAIPVGITSVQLVDESGAHLALLNILVTPEGDLGVDTIDTAKNFTKREALVFSKERGREALPAETIVCAWFTGRRAR